MIKKNAKSSTVTKLKGGSSLDIPPQLAAEELIPTINDRMRRMSTAALDTRAIAQAAPAGPAGTPGAAATVSVGSTTTGAAGSSAAVSNSGSSSAAVLDFTIPRGNTGAAGAAATVAVGSTTTGAAGSSAAVANSGSSSAAVLDFTIPRGNTGAAGAAGAAATVAVGTTTTGAAGSSAAVSNSGSSSAAVLDFTIPKGDTGATGAAGPNTIEIDKAGSTIGTRGKVNLIQGANVTLTVADNPGSSRVDVTIAAAAGGGGGFPWITLVDPSGVSFAWRNQGGATEDVVNQSRYLLSPATGGDNIRGREIAAPVSPWTMTAGFVPQIHSVNFNGMGLYVSDGTKLVTMDLTYAAMHINYLSNVTTWSSAPLSVPFAFSPPVLFYRVTVSGGNMTWYWSVDKVHWMQFYSASATAWLSAASYVGYFVNSNNGTWPAATLLVDWTQT